MRNHNRVSSNFTAVLVLVSNNLDEARALGNFLLTKYALEGIFFAVFFLSDLRF